MIMFLLLALPILFVPYLHVRRIIPSIRLLGADSSATGKIIKDKYSGDETWDGTSILIYYYEFTAKDNKHYTQYSFITDRIYSTGDMVNIHYTGSNPHFSFIKGGRYSPFNLDSVTTFIILLLLVLFGSMCWGLIFYNKPGAYRYISFLKKGIFIHGEIVYKIKKFSKYHYFYKYKDEQNRMRKGKYKTWDKEFAQSGSHVPVLYVHGWFRKDSMVVRPPLMYRKGVWTLNTKDMFFGEKGAIVLAGIRHFLWVDFLVMTVFDVIFGI